jgi:predicted aminopeptidase
MLAGCSTLDGLGYYRQSIGGHLHLLWVARPVSEVVADPATPPALRARLELSQRMREFAVRDLALPDNATYRRFSDLGRPSAVWNVVAAPELSLRLKTWCFPVVGCVGYRGYYAEANAREFGDRVRAEGYDVNVYGVPAYSTLGQLPNWAITSDPLLNTFIQWPEGELARLLFHELAHQVAFARDDTEFNESFATAVERLGGKRWLALHGTAEAREAYARLDGRRNDFRALTMRYRDRLEALFKSSASDDDKRRGKAELMTAMRADHEVMKRDRWGGFAGYDGWFERANNASLGVLAAYNALVPAFETLFARMPGTDQQPALRFEAFYAEVRRIAALPTREARRQALPAMAASDPVSR